ncbi:MAG: WXG100 family type VII secretion target [Verrucomicrobiota bacterium]
MSKAIVDPEELRRFAQELKKFNGEIQNSMSSLQARFSALGDTWQDHEHAKFAQDFQETIKTLRRFVESSEQQAPFLLRKAQRIEDYLNQR